jgi:hypothetical protein
MINHLCHSFNGLRNHIKLSALKSDATSRTDFCFYCLGSWLIGGTFNLGLSEQPLFILKTLVPKGLLFTADDAYPKLNWL